jgi:DNA polymerase-3 subunit epsilon
MNYWNQRVHGITSNDVANALSFEELWPEIKTYLDDQYVVAHNAAFDMGVLRASLAHYDMAVPWIEYFCSVSLSRKVWSHLPKHSLDALCEFHNIRFNHHRAGDDARACATITLKAFENFETNDVAQILELAKVKLKRLEKI